MLVKGKFLEKIKFSLTLVVVCFFSPILNAEVNKSQILNYNSELKNSSALFIQSAGQNLSEGEIFFGNNRIKINYILPEKLTIVLSKKKGMYVNHSLEETEFFDTKNSYIRFFFKMIEGNEFFEKTKITKNFIEITDSFDLDNKQYQIKTIYEKSPLKLRKFIITENKQTTEIGFFNHKKTEKLKKNFYSMIDPYLR